MTLLVQNPHFLLNLYIFVTPLLLIFALISQQPQSPKDQPKKDDQKGDDNKKQGGKHLNEPTFCQHAILIQ